MLTHGKDWTYGRLKCRCDPCRQAHAANARRQQQRYRENGPGPGMTHGNLATYTVGRCRCDLCRQANTEWGRERRRRAKRTA